MIHPRRLGPLAAPTCCVIAPEVPSPISLRPTVSATEMQWFAHVPLLLSVLAIAGFHATEAQGVPPGTQVGDLLYSTPSCAVRRPCLSLCLCLSLPLSLSLSLSLWPWSPGAHLRG